MSKDPWGNEMADRDPTKGWTTKEERRQGDSAQARLLRAKDEILSAFTMKEYLVVTGAWQDRHPEIAQKRDTILKEHGFQNDAEWQKVYSRNNETDPDFVRARQVTVVISEMKRQYPLFGQMQDALDEVRAMLRRLQDTPNDESLFEPGLTALRRLAEAWDAFCKENK